MPDDDALIICHAFSPALRYAMLLLMLTPFFRCYHTRFFDIIAFRHAV